MAERVIHFEIHADEPERACAFYRAVFGWTSKQYDPNVPYWLLTTGPEGVHGINGAIAKRERPVTSEFSIIAYVCTVDIKNIDETINKILDNGGSIVDEKMAVKGVGWLAYFRDTEGNVFGIMQADKAA
jgi:predicted enzyme related to lactoylglutathione lyase